MRQLTTARTIAVVVSALGLTCACGIGYHSDAPLPAPPGLEFISTSASVLRFSAAPGTTSAPQALSITNIRDVPVRIFPPVIPIDPKGDVFNRQTNCTVLEPAATCTVNLTFSPNRGGIIRSWIDIPVANAGPVTVFLVGNAPQKP